jgi:cell division protein FtsI/penicillin-binding protein 2
LIDNNNNQTAENREEKSMCIDEESNFNEKEVKMKDISSEKDKIDSMLDSKFHSFLFEFKKVSEHNMQKLQNYLKNKENSNISEEFDEVKAKIIQYLFELWFKIQKYIIGFNIANIIDENYRNQTLEYIRM